jgi:hypothetical protein
MHWSMRRGANHAATADAVGAQVCASRVGGEKPRVVKPKKPVNTGVFECALQI